MEPPAYDLLITANETNSEHGSGIFLQRLFPDSSHFVCLRTTSLYQGVEPFGYAHHEFCSRFLNLQEIEEQLRRILALYPIRRILCVPYYREEFIHALVAQRITGAPLCTFLMDDQNIFTQQVPDHWVSELLAASDLRLGISPEMCAAYQRKYGTTVHLLPPVLAKSTPLVPCYWQHELGEPLRLAMIGNVWTAHGLNQLRTLLRTTGAQLDWYGNGPTATWLPGTLEEWATDNIRTMGFYPEEDLIAALASYPAILVPTGTLDATDDNPAFSRLSLPSRLFFLHAHTDTPVMVLGSRDTAAARFVLQFGTGICASYDSAVFQKQIRELFDQALRQKWRRNIRQLAPALALPEGGAWLWQSLAQGRPVTADFHQLFTTDYLKDQAGFDALTPARPRRQWDFPTPGDSFCDRHASSFAFVRTQHLAVLAAAGLAVPAPDELELSLLHGAIARYVLQGSCPHGGDVLFLGEPIPPLLQQLPPSFNLWRITDLAGWQQAGYSGDYRAISNARTGENHPPRFPQFTAIVSTAWCGQLPNDYHVQEGLALFIEACTQPGGINLHLFSAILHSTYLWVGPAHTYFTQRFIQPTTWPDRDDLLAALDLFIMSEKMYNEHWKASIGKFYAAVGKPLSFALIWRKSTTA